MLKPIFFSLTLLFVGLILAIFIGIKHQESVRDALVATMNGASVTPRGNVDPNTFSTLPAPVQRYFKNVLPESSALIQTVTLRQEGRLKISPEAAEWSPFVADQFVSAATPGFVWDARIRMPAGLHVRVRDAYVDHTASGVVSLLSFIPLGEERGNPKLNNGALFRYLAEAPWYPTRLLPGEHLSWKPIDNAKALATLTDGDLSVTLEFRFNDAGEITGIYTENRYGLFNGEYRQYPWEGKFGTYKEFEGFRVPSVAEVGWHLPSGWWQFLTMRVTSVSYGF